jgi:hypothetical protein
MLRARRYELNHEWTLECMQSAIDEGSVTVRNLAGYAELVGTDRRLALANIGTCVTSRGKYANWAKYCTCGSNAWALWPFDEFHDLEYDETRVCVNGDRNGRLCAHQVSIVVCARLCTYGSRTFTSK